MKRLTHVLLVSLSLVAGVVLAADTPRKVKAKTEERWSIAGLRAEADAIQKESAKLDARRKVLMHSWDEVIAPITSRVEIELAEPIGGRVLDYEAPSDDYPDGRFFFSPAPPTGPPAVPAK